MGAGVAHDGARLDNPFACAGCIAGNVSSHRFLNCTAEVRHLRLNGLLPGLPLGSLLVNLVGGFIIGGALALFIRWLIR
ncbi:hypothetical protein EMIT0196MI5_130072 [Pseudomonas sp. IT-196MI5]